MELHSEGIINPTNDTEEQENGPLSFTSGTLKIKDDGKFIQEEVKEMDEATKMQLLKIASESKFSKWTNILLLIDLYGKFSVFA